MGNDKAESVRYEFPHPLPEGITIFGDCHSHCEMSAYTSTMDQRDEELFNGLHVVAGRIDQEPPHWHVEAAVDGARFSVDPWLVLEGYRNRDHHFPDAWRPRHSVHYVGPPPHSAATGPNYMIGQPIVGPSESSTSPGLKTSTTSQGTVNGGKTSWGGKPLVADPYFPSTSILPTPPDDGDYPEPRA